MKITAESIHKEGYALCVLGAGPGGIIVALEYARRRPNDRVLLVEYGGENPAVPNELDDTIVLSKTLNHHEPYECTNKCVGGSSATWGGRCVMYDRADFAPRAVVGDGCTWDESFFESCLPYVEATQRYFECGSGPFRLPDGSRAIAEGFTSERITDRPLERWSLPTRFGDLYGDELRRLNNLHLLTDAQAVGFPAPADSGEVSTVRVRVSGRLLDVSAKRFVVACGAQESTRLLLNSPEMFRLRGGAPFALGRYYQGHVSGKIATVKLRGAPRATEYGFRREADGSYQRRRFQFNDDVLVRDNHLNIAFWFDNPPYFNPDHRSGAMSFMYLAMLTPVLGKRLAPPAVAYSITKGKRYRIGRHLWNIVAGLPGSLYTPFSIFWRRYLLRRKLPGVFLYNARNEYALHFHAEQIPDENNRMFLEDSGRLVIDYEVTDADADGVLRAHEALDAELRRSGAGELVYWFSRDERREAVKRYSKDGVHQSGTTRVSQRPEDGVVDFDLKVWGVSNVYVCSSSVFPTSGQANPTFFMGVCALRLADRLIKDANR